MPVWRKPMSGAAERMVSPSSSSTMRSTPWGEGCCGPMLRVIRRGANGVAGSSSSAGIVPKLSSRDLFIWVAVFIAVDGIIFAQRMSVPIDRHQNAHQVWMITELDAEKIEHLALMPIGGAPDAIYGIDLGIVAVHFTFDAQAGIPFDRVEMIDDFKSRLGRIPVNGGEAAEADKFFFVLKIAAETDDVRRVCDVGDFAERLFGFENGRMAHLLILFRKSCGSSPDQSSTPFL